MTDDVRRLEARAREWLAKVAYPFHSRLMPSEQETLVRDLLALVERQRQQIEALTKKKDDARPSPTEAT